MPRTIVEYRCQMSDAAFGFPAFASSASSASGSGGAAWQPGCGIVREGMPPCESGLFLTFTKQYFDLTADITSHVDNHHHVITIRIDTWSYSTAHSRIAVRPQTTAVPNDDIRI